MSKRILLIQGHPDASKPHLCHALASNYITGAESTGHTVRHNNVAKLDFALLKAFLEQIYRPSFTGASATRFAEKRLKGRSSPIVVTMSMPALLRTH